jgi:hypothetical protein
MLAEAISVLKSAGFGPREIAAVLCCLIVCGTWFATRLIVGGR